MMKASVPVSWMVAVALAVDELWSALPHGPVPLHEVQPAEYVTWLKEAPEARKTDSAAAVKIKEDRDVDFGPKRKILLKNMKNIL
jgi:hypothetical protein